MPRFHALKVRELRRETHDCVSVSFEVPEELRDEYQFLHGQHLTLKTQLNGEEIRRSYSICTSPNEADLRVAIKKIPGGQFSSFANEGLQAGDTLDVMTPLGSFHTALDAGQKKFYVAFVAGSGITPVMSILKSVLETEPESHFTLFYGNRNTDTIIFRDQLDDLKNRYLQRLTIHHILSQEDPGSDLFSGRIDAGKCEVFCSKLLDVEEVDEFFLCGPEPMIFAVQETLQTMGVDSRKIHFELFTSPVGKLGVSEKKWTPPAQPILSKITITLDGNTFTFDHTSSDVPILDAAQKKGADLPFACKGGVCCTCKAKVLEGEVEMEVNYGLEAEEVEAGYVLTCQAHPKTDKLVLSFDE
jgi:ring-1,2-phenylacetyl-CoA epoxidase subunit PaaE